MAGYKTWVPGEEVLAADLQGFIQTQTVPRFTSTSQRTTQYLSPEVGALSYVAGVLDYWTGSAWAPYVPAAQSRVGGSAQVTNLSVANGAFVTVSTFTPTASDGGVTSTASGISIPANRPGVYLVALRISSSVAPVGNTFVAVDAFLASFSYVRASITAGQALATSSGLIPVNSGGDVIAQVSQNSGAAASIGVTLSAYRIGQ